MIFFFNDTATTEIYTLSLHDALPILRSMLDFSKVRRISVVPFEGLGGPAATDEFIRSLVGTGVEVSDAHHPGDAILRSEEHTSELQSHLNLVCRLLLEKKKYTYTTQTCHTMLRHRRPPLEIEELKEHLHG